MRGQVRWTVSASRAQRPSNCAVSAWGCQDGEQAGRFGTRVDGDVVVVSDRGAKRQAAWAGEKGGCVWTKTN